MDERGVYEPPDAATAPTDGQDPAVPTSPARSRLATRGTCLLAVAVGALASTAGTATAAPCGVDLGARAVTAAVATLPPYVAAPDVSYDWSAQGARGNYDPCATLSAAVVTVAGATASSPDQLLLFHRGVFAGVGGSTASFITLERATTSTTVVAAYREPGSQGTAGPSVLTEVLRFRWDGAKVVRVGATPTPTTTRRGGGVPRAVPAGDGGQAAEQQAAEERAVAPSPGTVVAGRSTSGPRHPSPAALGLLGAGLGLVLVRGLARRRG